MGALFGSIAVKMAETAFEDEGAILSTFSQVEAGRTLGTQSAIQLASLGITLSISVVGGAFSGWLTTRCTEHPEELFDDTHHFVHVQYP